MKTCNRCHTPKELTLFSKCKAKKDGYQSRCKECDSLLAKKWRNNNKDYNKIRGKNWRDANKTKVIENNNNWRINNPSYKKEYEKNRKLKDIIYRLKHNITSSVGVEIKRKGYTKKSRTYKIIGLTFEEFKNYIESKFQPWMNWDNYGKYNGELNHGWDIDHIEPLSSAKTEVGLLKLWNFKNLQPLCSKINRDVKKNKLFFT